jgi:hypothetical protein
MQQQTAPARPTLLLLLLQKGRASQRPHPKPYHRQPLGSEQQQQQQQQQQTAME